MNILFCNEGFIIDGVASYNLYLSAALKQAGHKVTILGRWAGKKGFQERHRKLGVDVIQCLSLSANNPWLIKQAVKCYPDVIISDSRRAFPLSQEIKKKTGAKVITIFHDPPQYNKKRPGRDISDIIKGSDAWVTAEKPIYEEIKKINANLPILWVQRPITGAVQPTPLPSRDPFKVLCLARLSRWKSPGIRTIIEKSAELKREIPSLEITVVGGGRRRLPFWWNAQKANLSAGSTFVHIRGPQIDPQPWIQQTTIVCAGATSAIEAILSERPVLAFSGFWMGLVTKENLEYGVSTHFAERQGEFHMRENPEIVVKSLIDLYRNWRDDQMTADVKVLSQKLAPDFDSATIANQFQSLIKKA